MQSLSEATSMKNKSIHLQKLLPVFRILKYLSIMFYIQSKMNRPIIKLDYWNVIIQKLLIIVSTGPKYFFIYI